MRRPRYSVTSMSRSNTSASSSCSEPYSAVMSRQHNDSNVLAFGARVVGDELAKMITRMWLATEFEGGRHQRRVNQINASECGVVIEDQVDPGAS